jgi:hypothetical protein
MIEKIKELFKDEEVEPEIKTNHVFVEKEPSKRKMRKRINTLEQENELLKETIKDELYKLFMKKLSEPEENKRYKEDNIRLRRQIKVLKQIIKEDSKDGHR